MIMTDRSTQQAALTGSIALTGVLFHRKGAPPKEVVLADLPSPFDLAPKGHFSALYGYQSRLEALADARVYCAVHAQDMLVLDIVLRLGSPKDADANHSASSGANEFLDIHNKTPEPLREELAGHWRAWLQATHVADPHTLYDWACPENFVPQRLDWVARLFEVWRGVKLLVHPGLARYSHKVHKFGTFKLGSVDIAHAVVRSDPKLRVIF